MQTMARVAAEVEKSRSDIHDEPTVVHPSTLRARMHKLGIVRPKTEESG
jgi:hypothetical protein